MIITTGELVFLAGHFVQGRALDLRTCAVLSRLLYRRPDRAALIPNTEVEPYTHWLVLRSSVFRVTVADLSVREAEAVGLGRPVYKDEVEDAGLSRPLKPVPVGLGLTPGETVQEAMQRGLTGFQRHP